MIAALTIGGTACAVAAYWLLEFRRKANAALVLLVVGGACLVASILLDS